MKPNPNPTYNPKGRLSDTLGTGPADPEEGGSARGISPQLAALAVWALGLHRIYMGYIRVPFEGPVVRDHATALRV